MNLTHIHLHEARQGLKMAVSILSSQPGLNNIFFSEWMNQELAL